MMATRREFLQQPSVVAFIAAAARQVGRSAVTNGTVQTVLGPLAASKLGFTLTHEHICKNPAGPNTVATAVDKLKAARDAGVATIVDVTTFDVGRDVFFGKEVSRRSGMQIVACTGQHYFAAESYNARSLEEITELFIKEIEQGIDGTEIKAGIIKVAARSDEMTPAEVKVFRAAARASKATGIPVATHTHASRRAGEKQAELLEAEGLSPARVSLGHSNDTDDMEYLTGLAKRGYTLGMDHAFWGAAPGAALPWQRRVECMKQLIDAGLVDRLFLSNDWVFGDIERDKINPDGLLYTTRKTIPFLKQLGVSRKAIHAMTVENPRRFLSRS